LQALHHPLILLLCYSKSPYYLGKLLLKLFFPDIFVRAFLFVMGTAVIDIPTLLFNIPHHRAAAMPTGDEIGKSNLPFLIIRLVAVFKLPLNLIEEFHGNNGCMVANPMQPFKDKMAGIELIGQDMVHITGSRLGSGGAE